MFCDVDLAQVVTRHPESHGSCIGNAMVPMVGRIEECFVDLKLLAKIIDQRLQ